MMAAFYPCSMQNGYDMGCFSGEDTGLPGGSSGVRPLCEAGVGQ
jgi:hypothetical protein